MKMLIHPYSLMGMLLAAFLANACDQPGKHSSHPHEDIETVRVTAESTEAAAPYLTQDHQGNPVLCWTEKEETGQFMMKYAVYDSISGFETIVSVTPSLGTRIHPESMNKLAFKADGTVVVVYSVKHPTVDNPFAGSIFYALSGDQGETWTRPAYLHSDTLPMYGRSFFDVVTLPDGEVGAIWLDGRNGDAAPGSALFFAKTNPGKGFGADKQIGEATCECCRTAILVDGKGDIHVAYRQILFPTELIGEQVRDMVHSVSTDGGRTFSSPQRVSADNWAIAGCPHTGPAFASTRQGLHMVWFTASGDPGVYHTRSGDDGATFGSKNKVSGVARHPQLASLPAGPLLMVWDESRSNDLPHSTRSEHQKEHTRASAGSQIMMQVKHVDGSTVNRTITPMGPDAAYAVAIPLKKEKAIIAWTQQDLTGSGILYRVVDTDIL